jgi:ribonuclease Y
MGIVIGILVGLIAGSGLTVAALVLNGGSRLAAARRTRQLLIQEARGEADVLRREAQLAAKEEAVRLREEIEQDVKTRQVEAARATLGGIVGRRVGRPG